MARIDFWFDFASTYSYLSAMRIAPLAEMAGVEVRWMPFLLGPVFKAQGWDTSPFNIYEVKGRYMWRDVMRQAHAYGIAFKRPDVFPQSALLATRVGVAAMHRPWVADFCRAVFSREYGEGGEITSRTAVVAALESCGVKPEHWLERAEAADVKQGLWKRDEEARALGIFGAPTFVTADHELFWGDDRLGEALAWAGGKRHI
jgi:2-hydroxychromene-2-carboxylate isomerase